MRGLGGAYGGPLDLFCAGWVFRAVYCGVETRKHWNVQCFSRTAGWIFGEKLPEIVEKTDCFGKPCAKKNYIQCLCKN